MVGNTTHWDDKLVEGLLDLEDLAIKDENDKQSLHYKKYDPVTFQILKVRPADFATQITLNDIAVFKSITSQELLSGNWSKKNKRTLAPNVLKFTDRFNRVCLWCQKEILAYDKPSKRAEVMAHFIKISEHLAMLNNMHSTFAIISALQCHSIHRLKRTWKCLGRRDQNTFLKLATLYDSDRNWEKLRQHLENTNLPCIPYLGIFLTDLNFIEAKNSENDSVGTSSRGPKLENIICKVKWFQHSSYESLPQIDCIQKYLASMQYHEELLKFVEDDIYKRSFSCEPDSPPRLLDHSLGPSYDCRDTTTSRRHFYRKKGKHEKFKGAIQSTPKTHYACLKRSAIGHRKTRSADTGVGLGSKDDQDPCKGGLNVRPCNVTFCGIRDPIPSVVCWDSAYDQMLDRISPCSNSSTFGKSRTNSQKQLVQPLVHDQTNVFSSCTSGVGKYACKDNVIFLRSLNSGDPVSWQGEVRKTVVRTRGSKPAKLKCSRKCYLELTGHSLNQFEHRTLAINCKRIRDHYRRKKSKKMVIGGDNWKVIGPQHENDASFELHHPATGRIYRYLCYSHTAAVNWHSKLLEASDTKVQSVIADLITFD